MLLLKIEIGLIESKMSWTVHKFGLKIGKIMIYKMIIRGFLAAGAQDMTIENATKEFTIQD